MLKDPVGDGPPSYADVRREELRALKRQQKAKMRALDDKKRKRTEIINNLRSSCNNKTSVTGLSFNEKTNRCDILNCGKIKSNGNCKKNTKCELEPKKVARKAGRKGSARRCLEK